MSNTVYCIGEVVYDIIFREKQPVAASPGGAMLNSAVSLGRSGIPVHFIGECGTDKAGDIIVDFLKKNSVGTSFLKRTENANTTVSLAFLDKNKDASYSFYKSGAGHYERIMPSFKKGDILLFGSYYAISDEQGQGVLKTVRNASEKGTVLFYDPNFRRPHLQRLKELRPLIKRNIRISDIIRGSGEDFELVFGTGSAEETWEIDCFRGNKVLIYTSGRNDVQVITEEFRKKYTVEAIEPVSTIGAGDSFNAGIIKSLCEKKNFKTLLKNLKEWDAVIEKGMLFARAACMSYENYIPEGFSK